MILRYSKNPFDQIRGILWYNKWSISFFFIWGLAVYILHNRFHYDMSIPVIPVTILGGALAIFLGFRNNSAYDRWWEARKVWGSIVNMSRHWGTQVIAYVEDKEVQNQMVHRHIGWLYGLAMHLRKKMDLSEIEKYLDPEMKKMLESAANVPVQILHRQGIQATEILKEGHITEFQHSMLIKNIEEFYTQQGKAERIKNTVFPFYYNYFTRVFLWLFIVLLPCAIVDSMNWLVIPIGAAIAFVFYILDKSGEVTEDPFEDRAADTPMSSLCRTIEIDLLQQIQAEDLPEKLAEDRSKYGVVYIK